MDGSGDQMPALWKAGKVVLRAGRDRSGHIWEEKTAEVILLFLCIND